MINEANIILLKKKARNTLLLAKALEDQQAAGQQVDTDRMQRLQQAFNRTMDHLAELDPTTPTERF